MKSNAKVLIIYTHYPHYRRPVFSALLDHKGLDFEVLAGSAYSSDGILSAESSRVGSLRSYQFLKFIFQTGFFAKLMRDTYGVAIFLGNPYVLSTWIGLLLCKLLGIKTLLWTHGWLDNDRSNKNQLRDLFYRLADGLVVYSERSKNIGVIRGFSPDRLRVIFNSLNYEEHTKIRKQFNFSECDKKKYILSVGRLIPELKLDLLLEALRSIKIHSMINFPLVVIGSGPEELALRSLALDYELDVTFMGAQYDEMVIAKEVICARAVVCPGKVGLTAMHSMVYGTPILTHNNLDKQMPEVEALINSKTGIFYDYGSVESLIQQLKWMHSTGKSAKTKADCAREIELNWTPRRQVGEIVSAINYQLNEVIK